MQRPTVCAILLFLIAFGFYLFGAYPSVSVGDSGEFIAAGHTLGIPHAPGYPSYVLLAKTIDGLIPWANPGYRINLLSVLFGALAVAVGFSIAWRLTANLGLSICSTLVLMLIPAHVANSRASEVFALHVFLCGAVLAAALYQKWLLSAFIMGWGLGNHQTLLFFTPALVMIYIREPLIERPPLVPLFLSLLAGFSVNAFLLFRAGTQPALNGGDPQTLRGLWRVLTRADYGSLTLALGETPARTWSSTAHQLGRFFEGMAGQLSWVGVGVGLIGAVAGIIKYSSATLGIATAFAFIGPVFFVLGNLPFDAQSNGLLERFYIVPAFCLTWLFVLGVDSFSDRWRGFRWLGFVLPLFLAIEQAPAFPFRHDFRAYAYGHNNLRTLPTQTLFIMDGGDDTFYTSAYLTQAEKRRLDLRLHDRGGVVFPGLYGADFRRLTRDQKQQRRQQVEQVLIASGQAIYYSTMNPRIAPAYPLKQSGLLYSPGLKTSQNIWPLYDLRGIAPWGASSEPVKPDYRARALMPFYAYQRGVDAASADQWDDAVAYSQSAYAQGADVLWLKPNLQHNGYEWSQKAFERGQVDLAGRIGAELIHWDSHSPTAWSNLGAIEEKKGNLDAAVQHYQMALKLDPGSEAAHYNLSVVYWKQENWTRVIEELNQVLAINPNNASAQRFLQQAEMRRRR